MPAVSSIGAWLRRNRDPSQPPSVRIAAILDDIEASNRLDCIYTVILEGPALARARQLDRDCATEGAYPEPRPPLLGVPVAVKDNIDMAGMVTSCGSAVLDRPAASSDAAIVRQLKLAGAIVVGKTNLDEAALGASGRNDHFGRCRNPASPEMLSGGSSSGSAAAVAAGHALLALGTDTLGSVRLPAALCGVAGFKPSHRRLDEHGVVPLYPGFDTVGLIAPGIADIACATQALGLAAATDPAQDFHTIWVLGDAHLTAVDPQVLAGYRARLRALHDCKGIRLRELPPFDFAGIARAAFWEVAHRFASTLKFLDAEFDVRRAQLGNELRQVLARAATLAAAKLDSGRGTLQTARSDLLRYLSEADALFTPTCPVAAVPAAAALPKTIAAFAAPANVAGLPAVCCPESLSGLRTVSWQLIGRPGGDAQLLHLADRITRLA